MEATHLCMSMRGVEKQNSFCVTSSMLGAFRDNARTRMEFLELIKLRTALRTSSEPFAACVDDEQSMGNGRWSVVACYRRSDRFAAGARRPDAPPDAQAHSCDASGNRQSRRQTLTCPSALGAGVTSKQVYCDVLTGRDPKEGIIIKLPARRGPLTLKFNLHNRHTYSEEQVRTKQAFASYTASIGVLTMDNTLLTRAVVASEFRTADDLVERISGGAGPGGVKAVAPVGSEPISVEIPADIAEVSLAWRKADRRGRRRRAGDLFCPGRPIADHQRRNRRVLSCSSTRPAQVRSTNLPIRKPPIYNSRLWQTC